MHRSPVSFIAAALFVFASAGCDGPKGPRGQRGLAGDPGTTSFADMSDSLTDANIQDNSISGTKIADGTIGTSKLADGAVDSAKIADGGVGGVDLADGAVGTSKLAAGAVTGNELANLSVDAPHIADGAVQTTHLLDASVTEAKIGADAVLGSHVKDGEIGTNDLANMAVNAAKIADAVVGSNHIADGAIGTDDLADGAVQTAKLLDSAVTPSKVSWKPILSQGALDASSLALGATSTSRSNIPVIRTPGTNSGNAQWFFILPAELVSGVSTVKVRVHWATVSPGDVSCDVRLRVWHGVLDGFSLDAPDNFANFAVIGTAPAAAGVVTHTDIPTALDTTGLQPGTVIRIRVIRDGTAGVDTCTGDVDLVRVSVIFE